MDASWVLGVIGAGNMAEAILKSALSCGVVAPTHVLASDPNEPRRKLFEALGAQTTVSNQEVFDASHVVLLATKPQAVKAALDGVVMGKSTLVVSILAGTSTATLEALLGEHARVVRVMPNTPVMVNEGCAGLARGARATADDMAAVRALFEGGSRVVVEVADEELIHTVTGLSGSGPAYVFRLIEGLVAGAVSEGLSEADATQLAIQTVIGAGKLAASSSDSVGMLREKVTSKKGTTHAGLCHLNENNFVEHVSGCVAAATARSRELAQE